MALSKPIIITPISAFDASVGTTIYYNVVGGTLPTRNRITVIDAQGDICYQSNWVNTFNNYCVIPANASYDDKELENGNSYFVYVETGDSNNNTSPQSNQVQFYCYTTPTFEFTDAPSTVPSSNYTFEAEYSQEENELLDTYIFTLYNAQNIPITTSSKQYASNIIPVDDVYTLTYNFGGLLDGQTFKIGLEGRTVENTILNIEPFEFTVQYEQVTTTGTIDLTNVCNEGKVVIQSSLDVHNGIPSNAVEYIDNKEADLRNNIVQWDDIEVVEDFTIRAVFRAVNTEPSSFKSLMYLLNDDGTEMAIIQYQYLQSNHSIKCIISFLDGTVIQSNILYGIPNNLTKFVMQVRYTNDEWSIAIGVYDQPTPTLYMDTNSNVYASYVGDTEPLIEYSLESADDKDNLIASYDDEDIQPSFNYDTDSGDIKITI